HNNHAGWRFVGTASLLLCRDVLMIAAIALSLCFTKPELHQRNEFSYHAIREVAILFFEIFSTMTPALQWLDTNAHRMPLNSAGQFFFTCGALSSALDNAPTYVTFLETELGKLDQDHLRAAESELRDMQQKRSLVLRPDLPDGTVCNAVEAIVKYHSDDILEG